MSRGLNRWSVSWVAVSTLLAACGGDESSSPDGSGGARDGGDTGGASAGGAAGEGAAGTGGASGEGGAAAAPSGGNGPGGGGGTGATSGTAGASGAAGADDGGVADDAGTASSEAGASEAGSAAGEGGVDGGGAEPSATASPQIDAVRGGSTGVIEGAAVTYVRPALGNDPAGFFLQAEATGPAVFVAVDAVTAGVSVGDIVDLSADAVTIDAGNPTVTAISGVGIVGSGFDVGALVQDVSAAADLVTALDAYRSEYVVVTGATVASFGYGGAEFESATFETAAVTGTSDLTFRLPAALREELGLVSGCSLTVGPTPLWAYNAMAEVQVYDASELSDVTCPAPIIEAVVATSPTAVRLRLDRPIEASTVLSDGTQFLISGLSVLGATVDGRTVTLTTSSQTPGQSYTVVAASSVEDIFGAGVSGAANSGTFHGYEVPAILAINEVNANVTGGCDLVELRVVSPGTLRGLALEERGSSALTFGAAAVQTNDIVVVHFNANSGTCNPSSHAAGETTAVDQTTGGGNYDTAFDWWTTDGGLTSSNNVLALRTIVGDIVDAVLLVNETSCAGYDPALLSEQAAAEVASVGQWVMLGGGVPTGGFWADNFCPHAVPDLDGTSTSAASGNTIQRLNDVDSNTRGDWSDAVAQSFGAKNAGQSDL